MERVFDTVLRLMFRHLGLHDSTTYLVRRLPKKGGLPRRSITLDFRSTQWAIVSAKGAPHYEAFTTSRYDPLVKFERLLETYLSFAPRGVQFFCGLHASMDEKETALFHKYALRRKLQPTADTYRISKEARSSSHMTQQFQRRY